MLFSPVTPATSRRKVLAAALSGVLAAALAGQPPVFAAPPERPNLKPQNEKAVPGKRGTVLPYGADRSAGAAVTALPEPSWPAAGYSVVSLAVDDAARPDRVAAPNAETKVGALPVYVAAPRASNASAKTAAAAPSDVMVQLLDRAAVPGPRRDGLVLRVTRADARTDAATVRVSVDYSAFRNAYGGDWSNRLRLVLLPDCGLTGDASSSADPACAPVPLESTNSATAARVSADVPIAALPAGSLGRTDRAGLVAGVPSAAVALTADASGSTGSFAATGLAASSTWQAGSSGGDFTWQYPMRVPPASAGPTPTIGLSYSSGSVDGRTAASNNQPTWIGEGFDFWPGYVQRRYLSCAEDMGAGANNTTKTGDQCWGTENAFLALNGSAVELVKDKDTGQWRPRSDNGSKVTVEHGAVNGDNDGEYWKVVTPDGTQYYFGLNRLPGWTGGKPVTNSAFIAPVYGNHAGEQCHQSTFAASSCDQAYTWNLDYVVDVYNNTMSYWYTKEGNRYAKNLATNASVPYDRSGYLSRIEYGTRADTIYAGDAPARVLFDTGDRCLTNCQQHTGANWTDTPWEQQCDAAACNWITPTFWTTRRLAQVTTQVWNGTGYRDVDQWQLRHEFLDPGDTTRAGLWLAGITHSGRANGTTTLPELTITGTAMNNRVDAVDHSPPMNWYRIASIRSETGAEINVEYSERDCIPGSRMPAAADANTLRCFPVRWTPPGATTPVNDYFHKYVATAVAEVDRTGGAPRRIVRYEYGQVNAGAPLWHYDDDDGMVPNPYKTWSQWRGYEKVVTRKGDPGEESTSEQRYYRGMHGDKLTGGGTRTVTIADSEGNAVLDDDSFAGMTRETIAFDQGAVATATVYTPWKSAPTATRIQNGITTYARYVDVAVTTKRTVLDGNRGQRKTRTTSTFDGYGMVSQVDNEGDLATTDDDQCVRTVYGRNLGKNLLSPVQRVYAQTLQCASSPVTVDDIGSDVRYSFDGQAYGVAPITGSTTTTEQLTGWTPTNSTYTVVGRNRDDDRGRVVESWDAAGERSATEYTAEPNGQVTATTTVNPLGHATTVVTDPAWGLPRVMIDPNGKRTEHEYDALGRLTAVWLPGRSKSANPDTPDLRHRYLIRDNGVVAITSEQLNAVGGYRVTHRLFDSLLRERQTQTPAYGGGRIVSDIHYDTVGRAWKVNYPYVADGAAETNLFTPVGDQVVPSQMVMNFDGSGRPVTGIQRSLGVERWRTSVTFGGDRVDGRPQGAAAVSRIENSRGQVLEMRTYRGQASSGAYDSTTYTYDRRGNLSTAKDPAGNVWRYEYDIQGRLVKAVTPDRGETRTTYTATDQIATTRDGNGKTLVYTYDALDRGTGVYEESVEGRKLATFTYDTLVDGTVVKGMPASATRWDDGHAYTSSVLGYTDRYQTTGTTITVPENEGALAGNYSFTYEYNVDGSAKTFGMPAAGGLPAETLQYGYESSLGLPDTLRGATTYVTGTTYTRFGETAVLTRSIGGKIVQTGVYYNTVDRFVERILTVRETSPATIADLNYTYDKAGNITSVIDRPAGGVTDAQCYRYDHANRLTEAWTPASADCGPNPTASGLGGPAPYWQSWTLDELGNRKKQVTHGTTGGDQTTNYTYPAAGSAQPHTLLGTSTTDATGAVIRTTNYAYDAAGNTTSRTGATGEQVLGWNSEGFLRSVTEGTKETSNVYDAAGDRLIRRDPTATTLYLGPMELRLDRGTNTVRATRYYSHDAGVICMRDTAGVTWLINDHQGTGQWAVKAAGPQQVTVRRTTPYGEVRGAAVAWPSSRGFHGGVSDDTGLTHLGVREYDSSIGRFVSADRIQVLSQLQQLHGYSYANNNPATQRDATGLAPCVSGSQSFLCKMQCFFGCGGPKDYDEDGVISAGDLAGSYIETKCPQSVQYNMCGQMVGLSKVMVDLYADLNPIPINDSLKCQQGSWSSCAWAAVGFFGLIADVASVTKAVSVGAKTFKGMKVVEALRNTLTALRSAMDNVLRMLDDGARATRGLINKIGQLGDAIRSVRAAIDAAKVRTIMKVKKVTTTIKTTVQTVRGGASPAGSAGRGPLVPDKPILNTDADIPPVIYRGGTTSPSNLRLRAGEDALSFRDSLSDPLPPAKPVFKPGDNYTAYDTSKLPKHTVVPDGVPGNAVTPPGHVSVYAPDAEQLKNAKIPGLSGKFPKA